LLLLDAQLGLVVLLRSLLAFGHDAPSGRSRDLAFSLDTPSRTLAEGLHRSFRGGFSSAERGLPAHGRGVPRCLPDRPHSTSTR
jgi:hypothetical protein